MIEYAMTVNQNPYIILLQAIHDIWKNVAILYRQVHNKSKSINRCDILIYLDICYIVLNANLKRDNEKEEQWHINNSEDCHALARNAANKQHYRYYGNPEFG